MKNIVLIIPYFGKLPDSFQRWKLSALKNEMADFLIFTDCMELQSEKNIIVEKMTFEEYRNYVQSKFDFPIKLGTPYKTCDYKAAYGYIFEKYVRDYRFWGHCDIDLIFGDMSTYLTEEMLDTYDKIYELGHLVLYRNIEQMNTLFMDDGPDSELNYRDVFTVDDVYAFDEYYGAMAKAKRKCIKAYTNNDDFFDVKVDEFAFQRPMQPVMDKKRTIFHYKAGKLYERTVSIAESGDTSDVSYTEREILYAHFQKRNIDFSGLAPDAEEYFIIPNKAVSDERLLTEEYNRKSGNIKYKVKIHWKKKIGKVKTHISKYRRMKAEGEISSWKEYIVARKTVKRRFEKMDRLSS